MVMGPALHNQNCTDLDLAKQSIAITGWWRSNAANALACEYSVHLTLTTGPQGRARGQAYPLVATTGPQGSGRGKHYHWGRWHDTQ